MLVQMIKLLVYNIIEEFREARPEVLAPVYSQAYR